jgi:hypothetical protein
MRHELTADTLARLILWGRDEAMTGSPHPLRLRCASTPNEPLTGAAGALQLPFIERTILGATPAVAADVVHATNC